MRRIRYIIPALIVFLNSTCENGEGVCTVDVISRVNAGFYVRDSLEERDTLLNNFTFYGTLRPDSLLYDSADGVKKIVFPLPNSTEDYSIFEISVDTVEQSIYIYHTPSLVMISYACGFTTNHNIYWISYDKLLIDTIMIPDPVVNLENEENIKIYIKPAVADTAI